MCMRAVGASDQRAWSAACGSVHAWRRACAVCQRRCWLSTATQLVLSVDVLRRQTVPVQTAKVYHRSSRLTPTAL